MLNTVRRLPSLFTRLPKATTPLIQSYRQPFRATPSFTFRPFHATPPKMTLKLKDVDKKWWKEVVCYQIYPASFADSNGDGTGDLQGIISKLDYLKELGVDVVWLCPIYKSPQVDMGYDISDYRDIDPQYGTIQDWEELLEGLHARGMKLIMDLVVNHSASVHQWFLDSASSKTNPKRDWYVWKDAKFAIPQKDGSYKEVPAGTSGAVRRPPNNWRAIWGGSAWEWYPETEQYGLHIFAKEQPDFNWHCDELREAIHDDMRFWLDKGIDGFRLDAITHISKQFGYPDAPITEPEEEFQHCFSMFNHGPKCHDWLQEMHEKVLSKYDIMTVGEAGGTTPEQAVDYVSQNRAEKEMCMIFNTDHMDLYGPFETTEEATPQKLSAFKQVLSMWQNHLADNDSWNSLFCENHDQPRSISERFGSDLPEFRVGSAKALAVLFQTLSGTPYIYQGQEIGMKNVPREWPIEEYLDLVTQMHYKDQLERRQKKEGPNPNMKGVMAGIQRKARDNARTPMAWDSSPTAGFTTGKPWMSVNPDNKDCNVKDQLEDQNSVMNFYKKMIKLRHSSPTLIYGEYELYEVPGFEETIWAYNRKLDDQVLTTVINFSKEDVEFPLAAKGKIVVDNFDREGVLEGTITLQPYEAMVLDSSA